MNRKNVTLSVIITSYNYSRYIAASIESVLDQSNDCVQLIVVDDHSTDNSRDIISDFGERITPIFQPQNMGHGAAFNTGFASATGDLVMFLDADDFLLPGAISNILERYEPEVSIYHYRMRQADINGVLGAIFPPAQRSLATGDISLALRQRGRYNSTVTSGLVFSRSALLKVMPMDAEAFRQGGDGYLTSVVPLYGPSRTSDLTISAYRIHGMNHSVFTQNLSNRARWALEHDQARYAAITQHAQVLDLPVATNLGRKDEKNLEQKLTLSLLDAEWQKSYGVGRRSLAWHGLSAVSDTASIKSRIFQVIWWLVMGWAPRKIAQKLITWKLNSDSRPQLIRDLAKVLRHRLGIILR